MASAQVLRTSVTTTRKQGHLEAGKKRLEEFRKKKAEGRAKKADTTNQLQLIETSLSEKLSEEPDQSRLNDVSVTAFERNDVANLESSMAVIGNDNSASYSLENTPQNEQSKIASMTTLTSGFSAAYSHLGVETKGNNGFEIATLSSANGPASHKSTQRIPDLDSSTQYSSRFYPMNASRTEENGNFLKEISVNGTSKQGVTVSSTEKLHFYDTSQRYKALNNGLDHGGLQNVNENMDFRDSNTTIDANGHPSSLSTDSSLSLQSSNLMSLSSSLPMTESASRRSRPSFLDSLNISRTSSVTHTTSIDTENNGPLLSYKHSTPQKLDMFTVSASQESFTQPSDTSSISVHKDAPLILGNLGDSVEKKNDILLPDNREDFSALEQHIEDLTREKFSLQRALDASRTLADSLAAENSSLTDSFNQQGAVVNQLRLDIKVLQEEMKAQMLELESMKAGYANAELECNAADERAKILASEVITLEEKTLRLRSNELKLERDMENTNAEVTSLKRKISSLEKDRYELQGTINALQEEKKLLQSKLRKASADEKVVKSRKTSTVMKDASTCTEDLDAGVSALIDEDIGSLELTPNTSELTPNALELTPNTLSYTMQEMETINDISNFSVQSSSKRHLQNFSGGIPHDQLRIISNINSLVSELSQEKEEITKALALEKTDCSTLKELNKELSKKLEAQTQRLELLTAQRMASENSHISATDSYIVLDNVAYTDEGDEVVERVLNWIMKLFPGGPSRRRSSKLL